jgi:hypothetical protein
MSDQLSSSVTGCRPRRHRQRAQRGQLAVGPTVAAGRCRHGGGRRRAASGAPARQRDRPRRRASAMSSRLPLRAPRQQRRAVAASALIVLAGAIPFQHREFGMVQRRALAIAEDAGEIEDAPLAGRQQLLGREFRRGVQVIGMARAASSISVVAKPCRCVSLPGETCRIAASTSTKSRVSNQRRSALLIRPRASRIGRRSAWMSGRQKGGGPWLIGLASKCVWKLPFRPQMR